MWRTLNSPDAAGGQYAYISNWTTGNVKAYAIDAKGGALKSLHLTVTVAGGGTQPVAIDPTGKFAYVASFFSNDVYAYAIDAASGKLTAVPGSPFAAGTEPDGVTTDPTGKFVYVLDQGAPQISEFSLAGTGALTPLSGSPVVVAGIADCMAFVSP